jgi:hypothetical protein
MVFIPVPASKKEDPRCIWVYLQKFETGLHYLIPAVWDQDRSCILKVRLHICLWGAFERRLEKSLQSNQKEVGK